MSVSLRTKKLSYSIGKMNVALDLNFKSYYVNIDLFSNAYSTPFSLNLNYDSNYLRWYLNMELVMIYVPDVVENVKKDGFQLSDFFTINKNNYKEYLSKTIVGGLTGYIGALGLNAFFSAPLVGVLNTLSESISGNIHSREELLINFSISTMISFLTLGTPRITLKFKKPCIPRVLPNKFNRIMESILYNFEKIGYYYGQSIDTSVSLTLILLEVIKN